MEGALGDAIRIGSLSMAKCTPGAHTHPWRPRNWTGAVANAVAAGALPDDFGRDPFDDTAYDHTTHHRCDCCKWLWPLDFQKYTATGLPKVCELCSEPFARIGLRRETREPGEVEKYKNMETTPTESGMGEDDDSSYCDGKLSSCTISDLASDIDTTELEADADAGVAEVLEGETLPQAVVLGVVGRPAKRKHGPSKPRATPSIRKKLRPSRAKATPGDSWKSQMVQRETIIDHDRPESKTEGGAQYGQIVNNMKRPFNDADNIAYHEFLASGRCHLAATYGPDLSGLGGYECNNSKINEDHCQAMFIGVYSLARMGRALVEVGPGDNLPKWAERQKVGKARDQRFHKNSLRAGYFSGEGHPWAPDDDPSLVVPCKSRADYRPEKREAALEYLCTGPALQIAKAAKPKVKSIDTYQQANEKQKAAMLRTACNNEMVGWDNYVPLVSDPEREALLRELAVVELWALGPTITVGEDLNGDERTALQEQIERARAIVEKHSEAREAAHREAVDLAFIDEDGDGDEPPDPE